MSAPIMRGQRGQNRVKVENPVTHFFTFSNNGTLSVYNAATKEKIEYEKKDFLEAFPNGLSFCPIMENFYLKGFNNKKQRWYRSTPYQFRNQEIRIWKDETKDDEIQRGSAKLLPEAVGSLDDKDIKASIAINNMSTEMNIYATLSNGDLCKISLSPSGRGKYFEFKNLIEEANGGEKMDIDFKIVDIERTTNNEDDNYNAEVPAFEFIEPSSEHLSMMLVHQAKLTEYFAQFVKNEPKPE